MIKNIILCADDYGENPSISQAIIKLVTKKRLSAVSAMVTGPNFITAGAVIAPYSNAIDIGIHFNLTKAPLLTSLKPFSLKKLILHMLVKKELPLAIIFELKKQFETFVSVIGKAPVFIDGHQHIHELPLIRDFLLKQYKDWFVQKKAYVRSTYIPHAYTEITTSGYIKKNIIQWLGAKSLQEKLLQMGIPHNSAFSGIYNFKTVKPYPLIFQSFLRKIVDRGLIMCHPGLLQGPNDDPIAMARANEFTYFISDGFLQDLSNFHIALKPFNFF